MYRICTYTVYQKYYQLQGVDVLYKYIALLLQFAIFAKSTIMYLYGI